MILKQTTLSLAFYAAVFGTFLTTNSIAQEAINTPATPDIRDEIKPSKTAVLEHPWLVLGGLAYHSCRDCGFRERNPGLALQWQSPWFEELTGLAKHPFDRRRVHQQQRPQQRLRRRSVAAVQLRTG